MEAEKFPAMAEVRMTSRLAGPARDQISQLRSQIPFQIPFSCLYPVNSSQ